MINQFMKLRKIFRPLKIIKTSVLIALGCLWNMAAIAQGTLTWNWTYAGWQNVSGTGTLTTAASLTTNGSNTGYLITGITGTWNPGSALHGSVAAITGLIAVGTMISGSDGTFNDNLLLGISTPQLDGSGFAFNTSSGQYSLSYYFNFCNASDNLNYVVGGDFSAISASPVPEPTTNALLLATAASLFVLRTVKSSSDSN
jgi:hypothetical protein